MNIKSTEVVSSFLGTVPFFPLIAGRPRLKMHLYINIYSIHTHHINIYTRIYIYIYHRRHREKDRTGSRLLIRSNCPFEFSTTTISLSKKQEETLKNEMEHTHT